MTDLNILTSSGYDRLTLFYQQFKNTELKLEDYEYKGYKFKVPEVEDKSDDKNLYRKYLNVPMSYGHTKHYIISLFGVHYRLYKQNSRYYFIDCGPGVSDEVKEFGFGLSNAYSYVAMMMYELLMRLNKRKHYVMTVDDQVYSPIFDYPQWKNEEFDAKVKLTMHSYQLGEVSDPKLIALSIFK